MRQPAARRLKLDPIPLKDPAVAPRDIWGRQQTLVNRWAYGAIYGSSGERAAALPGWLTYYNFTRRHGSLAHKPPGARLHELTNVAGNYN